MKEHIQAQFTNELRDIAIAYHDYELLRELLARAVEKYLRLNEEWYKEHPDDTRD